MLRKAILLGSIAAIAMAASQSPALAQEEHVLINFENLSDAGGPGSGARVTVTRQYAREGVIFNGPSAFDYALGRLAIPTFPHSPSRAVEHCYGLEFCSTPFVLTFRRPQRKVQVLAGHSSRTLNGTAVIEGYDRNGRLIGRASAKIVESGTPVMNTLLMVESAGDSIYQVRISSPDMSPSGFAIDDVEFFAGAPPPPPPADILRVPSVIGLSRLEAQDSLARQGLAMTVAGVRDTVDVPADVVLAQKPAGGTPLGGVRFIQVVLARIPAIPETEQPETTIVVDSPRAPSFAVIVPNLRGMTIGEAQDTLAVLRLRLEILGSIEADGTEGSVHAQDPEPGARLTKPRPVLVHLVAAHGAATNGSSPPPWIWLVLAGVAAVLAVYTGLKGRSPKAALGAVTASIATNGVRDLAAEVEGPVSPVAELRYALETNRSNQDILGELPAIVKEERLG